MPRPGALVGDSWTRVTARQALPILVWCAEHGRAITYDQLRDEVVRRRLGHRVMEITYRYVAGAIGFTLVELEERSGSGELIPPLNSLVINAATGLPGSGGVPVPMAPNTGKPREKGIGGADELQARQCAGSSAQVESGQNAVLTVGTASRRGTRLSSIANR